MNVNRLIRTTLCFGMLLGSFQFLSAQVFGKLQVKAPMYQDLSANAMYTLENVPNHRSQIDVVNLYSGNYNVQVLCRWKDMYRAKDMGTDRSFLIRMGDVVQLNNNLSQINSYYDTQTAARLTQNLSGNVPYCIDRRYTTTYSPISYPNGPSRGGNPIVNTPVQSTPSRIHIVKPKETLYSIGRLYNISHQELMAVNGMASSDIYPNQRLRIEPSGMRSSPQDIYRSPEPLPIARTGTNTFGVNTTSPTIVRLNTFPQAPQRNDGIHEVRKGETLFSIAQQYGLTSKYLAELNGIKDPKKLKAGVGLRISPLSSR